MCSRSVDINGTFEAKGVTNAKERLSFVAAEVREPFPAAVKDAGVDTLVMKHFLSGFSDADARTILKHCKEIMPSNGKILLLQVGLSLASGLHGICTGRYSCMCDGNTPGGQVCCVMTFPQARLDAAWCFTFSWC